MKSSGFWAILFFQLRFKGSKVQRFKGSEGQSFECANLKMCQFEDLKMCKMTPELEGEYL